MLCKRLPGTDHVDLGGNTVFLDDDSVCEIETKIRELISYPEKYESMKKVAVERGMRAFSYADIAKRSIEV